MLLLTRFSYQQPLVKSHSQHGHAMLSAVRAKLAAQMAQHSALPEQHPSAVCTDFVAQAAHDMPCTLLHFFVVW
jgi:hypothetical protein